MEDLVLEYEYFRKLAEKQRLTAEDKASIETLAKEHDITLNKRCSSCYKDAAIQLALLFKPKGEPAQEGEYELHDGIDITIESYQYGVLKVNKANCTPANARLWRNAGLPLRFFKRYPKDESNEQH